MRKKGVIWTGLRKRYTCQAWGYLAMGVAGFEKVVVETGYEGYMMEGSYG
jgi:hypothetical protein